MQFDPPLKLKFTDGAPDWLVEAVQKGEKVGSGSFCKVLASPDDNSVVKLSRAKADLDAHEALTKKSLHFPQTFRRCDGAIFDKDGVFHALELERVVLASEGPLRGLTEFLYRQKDFKLTPLLSAAEGIRTGKEFASGLPISLGIAIDELARYALSKHGFSATIDLYTLQNWGERADGTLVIIDPLNLSLALNVQPPYEAGTGLGLDESRKS